MNIMLSLDECREVLSDELSQKLSGKRMKELQNSLYRICEQILKSKN